MKKNTKDKVTGVRLPPDLLDCLTAWAEDDGRSLSNLIVKLLSDAVSERRNSLKS
jgi:hypothetical protein